ncbi:protein EARLY FLOWERING 3-like [Forsythia ovata]|uniref:Protein EARLY FLOWERING 3-like n=1 Tax=Forsythia ovata TaxID=205694 RepID=A0ABD1W5V0_9LAMI
MKDFPSEQQNIVYDISNDAETREDRGDSVSETSMVRIIFGKPGGLLLINKKFLQFKYLSCTRLVKVQRSIAGSPHLLLEDAAYSGKPVKASPAKKLLLDYNVEVPLNVSKRKRDSNKPGHPAECSA